jgi:cell division transport system ATP-binding protein
MEERTVLENVSFPLHLQGIWGRKARKRAEKACALAGLEDGLGRRCRELARGEQQLACLARAIVAEPSLLLADEPTAHLDAKRTLHVLNLLARVNARGTTVVLASGDLMVAGAFPTHREIQLRGGRLVGDGPSESERQTGLPKPARADALCEVTSSGQCAKQRSRSGTSAGGDEISKAVEHGKGA